MRNILRFFSNKSKGKNNLIEIGKKIDLKYKIFGNNNKIFIEDGSNYGKNFKIKAIINGSGNKIIIKTPYNIKRLYIAIGNQEPVNDSLIFIDEYTSMVQVNILVFQHNSQLYIGKDCMFSQNIQIRTGELPHLIFNCETGEYLDKNSCIKIGNHVWVGENSMILKNASIADNNIVGCNSVVTKVFDESRTVIAGNPAKIRKRSVEFVRNFIELKKYDKYLKFYEKFKESLNDKISWGLMKNLSLFSDFLKQDFILISIVK